MPTTSLYTSTPSLRVGGEVNLAAMRDLLFLRVDEDIEGMTFLEARFFNVAPRPHAASYPFLDRDPFDFGTELAVALGPAHDSVDLFTGKVSALCAEYSDGAAATFSICAEDALQDFRLTRRTRTFEESTTADIAETLAADHGLTTDIDLDAPSRRVVNQLNLSDLAFLRRLAEADGAEIWLDGDTLHLQRRADRDAGGVTLTFGGNLVHFAVRADLAHQCTDLTVTGWSVADKEAIEELAGSDALGAELASGDTSGTDALATAFAARHERMVVAEPLAADDARSRAKAAYLARARRFVTGTGTTAGTPGVRVGARCTLDGLGAMFNGEYRVTRTCHRFDLRSGYETEFDVERVGMGPTR